jgi:hypothetical protein
MLKKSRNLACLVVILVVPCVKFHSNSLIPTSALDDRTAHFAGLVRSQVTFSRLQAGMAQCKLDLLKFTAVLVRQLDERAPQVMCGDLDVDLGSVQSHSVFDGLVGHAIGVQVIPAPDATEDQAVGATGCLAHQVEPIRVTHSHN